MSDEATPRDNHAAHQPPWGSKWKGRLAAAAGVLVGIPAVLNGAMDVYVAVAKLPRTDAERVNDELFKKYFRRQPVAEMPVPIKHKLGTFEVRFAVFEEGDVFVEYGKQTQWFAFPKTAAPTGVALSLVPSAHAQAPAPATGAKAAAAPAVLREQRWQELGSTVQRTRIYSNGDVERSVIDQRTGSVLRTGIEKHKNPAQPATAQSVQLYRAPVIDLSK